MILDNFTGTVEPKNILLFLWIPSNPLRCTLAHGAGKQHETPSNFAPYKDNDIPMSWYMIVQSKVK